ncbi:S-adenosylmethionine synthetase [Candidatus Phytoplasma phoenicium]|uniref:Methionine adenosyltransferase n=1 Tax=Candidatus Phytoplasma phoenicium TaxID=198422 RepID=A0A0L0MJ91_9MOLU|nr:methionine adenosyltransferase [Candidatus Phytoplasma phoenicium]KND62712.1 S-adenosylmethionine synthetase [Candidatus Phytoplasma phoenicium]
MKKFSSEAVTKGHPDKVADQISDALLDAYLSQESTAKVAIETVVSKQKVIVLGEIKTTKEISSTIIEKIIRKTIKKIGYDKPEEGFDYNNVDIINLIHEQSMEINQAVEKKGAGDQGMMFGYATNETSVYLPLNFVLVRQLARKLTETRINRTLPFLRPDGKTQLTISYNEQNQPLYINSIIISCQHSQSICLKELEKQIIENIINTIIPKNLITFQTKFYINPSGSFLQGGPSVDTGLTGRKIIQDSYGSEIRHGGGCFSGKDASKVDRSGAYMARYLSKNIVASGICNKCEIQISYGIGLTQPLGIYLNTFQTNKIPEKVIISTIEKNFDLSPQGIIKFLNLTKPIFSITASEGHFGREDNLFAWEKIDKKNIFAKLMK